MNRLFSGIIVLVLLGTQSAAVARTWRSLGGRFTTEADLVDFKDGQASLKKADGQLISVPLLALCEEDRQFVQAQFPGVEEEQFRPGTNFREWTSRDGRFTTLAEFLDFSHGAVHLRRANRQEISVSILKLSLADQNWLREELVRQREAAKQERGVGGEEGITGPIGRQTVSMKLLPLDPPVAGSPAPPDAMVEYMLLLTKPQLFYMDVRNGDTPHEADFRKIVREEPDYKAPLPFRAVARFGSREYAFCLDAVGKNTAGYNQLYFDLNQNGDLTDDKPIPAARFQASASARYAQSQFPRVNVEVEADGVKLEHAFLMSVLYNQLPSSSYASASFYAGAVREGYVIQGGRKIRLVLVDHNSNGRFDDPVSVRRSGSQMYLAEGDLLLVNPNSANRLSSDATMGRDRYFVGRTLSIGNHYYKLEVSPLGDRLDVEPTELAIGHVANPSPAYRAVIYSDDYGVLVIEGTKNQEIPLPACQWKLVNYAIDASAFAGGSRTAVTAAFSENPPVVKVSKDQRITLPFGAPFRLVVTASRAGDKGVYLSLSIIGVRGERCTGLYVNGRRPQQPSFVIRDQDNKVVHQGTFEYG